MATLISSDKHDFWMSGPPSRCWETKVEKKPLPVADLPIPSLPPPEAVSSSLRSCKLKQLYDDLRKNDPGNWLYESIFLPLAKKAGVACGKDDFVIELIKGIQAKNLKSSTVKKRKIQTTERDEAVIAINNNASINIVRSDDSSLSYAMGEPSYSIRSSSSISITSNRSRVDDVNSTNDQQQDFTTPDPASEKEDEPESQPIDTELKISSSRDAQSLPSTFAATSASITSMLEKYEEDKKVADIACNTEKFIRHHLTINEIQPIFDDKEEDTEFDDINEKSESNNENSYCCRLQISNEKTKKEDLEITKSKSNIKTVIAGLITTLILSACVCGSVLINRHLHKKNRHMLSTSNSSLRSKGLTESFANSSITSSINEFYNFNKTNDALISLFNTQFNNESSGLTNIYISMEELNRRLIAEKLMLNFEKSYNASAQTPVCQIDRNMTLTRIGVFHIADDRNKEVASYLYGDLIGNGTDVELAFDTCYRLAVIMNNIKNINISAMAVPEKSYIRLRYINQSEVEGAKEEGEEEQKEVGGTLRKLKSKLLGGFRKLLLVENERNLVEYVKLEKGMEVLKMDFIPGREKTDGVELKVVIDTGKQTYIEKYVYNIKYEPIEESEMSSLRSVDAMAVIQEITPEIQSTDMSKTQDVENLTVAGEEDPQESGEIIEEQGVAAEIESQDIVQVKVIHIGRDEEIGDSSSSGSARQEAKEITEENTVDFNTQNQQTADTATASDKENTKTYGNSKKDNIAVIEEIEESVKIVKSAKLSYLKIFLSACAAMGISAMAFYLHAHNKGSIKRRLRIEDVFDKSNISDEYFNDVVPKMDSKGSVSLDARNSFNNHPRPDLHCFNSNRVDLDSAAGSTYHKEPAFEKFKGIYFPFKSVVENFFVGVMSSVYKNSLSAFSATRIFFYTEDSKNKYSVRHQRNNRVYPVSIEIS